MGGGGGGGCCIGNCCIVDIPCCVGDFPCIDTPRGCLDLFGKHKKDDDDHERTSSGSRSGGQTGSYNPNTTNLENTIKVQHALTDFKTDTQERSTQLENKVIELSRKKLDVFIDELRDCNNIRYAGRSLSININHIERENRKTEDTIHGFIVKRVAKRISLDDSECLEILKLNPGKEKEEQLDQFYRKVLKEAVLELSDELRHSMETQTDNVCDTIQHRIDDIVETCEAKTAEFERIRQVKASDGEKIEHEQIRLSHFIALCDYGLSYLD